MLTYVFDMVVRNLGDMQQSICSGKDLDKRPEVLDRTHLAPVDLAHLRFGSQTFDVTSIDVTTLAFGPGVAPPAHDLTDSFAYHRHLQDVNLDGLEDLITHFRVQDTGIVYGKQSATLTGETFDGRVIDASDSIATVECRQRPDFPTVEEANEAADR